MVKQSSIIEAENVVFDYPGFRALDDVSLSLPAGNITALVGPNGAGKTTLMRCLAGLQFPIYGTIKIAGIDTRHEPRKVHDVIGYLSDFFGLYDDLTVEQHLKYFAWAHHIPSKDIPAAIDRVIRLCHLQDYLNHEARGLSRGWRQRVGIAQAILHNPKLIILDEPASGLDPEARSSLSVLVKDLKKEGASLLVSSHILSELEDYCDNMIILKDGKIVDTKKNEISTTEIWVGVRIEGSFEKHEKKVSSIEGVATVKQNDDGVIMLHYTKGEAALAGLLKELVKHDVPVTQFGRKIQTMQESYLDIVSGKDK